MTPEKAKILIDNYVGEHGPDPDYYIRQTAASRLLEAFFLTSDKVYKKCAIDIMRDLGMSPKDIRFEITQARESVLDENRS